jgi:hypothetical protein
MMNNLEKLITQAFIQFYNLKKMLLKINSKRNINN